jgi:hypothetical protein
MCEQHPYRVVSCVDPFPYTRAKQAQRLLQRLGWPCTRQQMPQRHQSIAEYVRDLLW